MNLFTSEQAMIVRGKPYIQWKQTLIFHYLFRHCRKGEPILAVFVMPFEHKVLAGIVTSLSLTVLACGNWHELDDHQ